MPEYTSPVDIGNRALQHVGAEFMDPGLGFNENSKRAQQVSFNYGGSRRAELRRNSWRFAIKKAALRAIDSNTMLLAPAMWVQNTTYFFGSIVSDQTNTLWRSLIPINVGNQPGVTGNDFAWEPYFGPMTVALYDSSLTYFAGELVYTAAGDGTYNAYVSNVNANAVHPALPNQWAASTTYAITQVVQQFPAWSSGTTYTQGQTVLYTDGNVYSSLTNGNLNHIPAASSAFWAMQPTLTLQSQAVPIFLSTPIVAPQSSPVLEWAIGTTYSSGTFVMFNATMWLSIANNNTGKAPNAVGSTFWVAVTGGTFYASLINLNFNNNPATTFVAAWSATVTYSIGQKVTGSDGQIYISQINGNTGNQPVLGPFWTATGLPSPWTTTFVQGDGNSQWTQVAGVAFPLGVGITLVPIGYPVNVGPLTGTNGQSLTTRAIFRLPAGYLGPAMQDPKQGAISFLGAPSGLQYNNWLIENNFIVTPWQSFVMVFRFTADFTDVSRMDDMFCEGLAARIAVAICEPLTQSAAKIQSIRLSYKEYMGEARLRNAIEIGAEEPPLDDFISTRS
jgi:hypothetical protein